MIRPSFKPIARQKSVDLYGLAILALGVAMLGAGCGDRLEKLVGNDKPASSTEVMVIRGVPPPSAAASTETRATNP